MDTNSNIPVQKKVARLEFLRVNELGYGPKRTQTRGEWQKECLENLLAGSDVFKAWQEKCISQETGSMSAWPFPSKPYYFVLNFETSIFTQELNLFGYEFLRDVSFKNAEFVESKLWLCKFHKNADFCGATFKNEAEFNLVSFYGNALYKDALFEDTADFSGAIFDSECDFFKTQFQGKSLFTGTFFKSQSNFENAIFNNIGHFERAVFQAVPSFLGVNTADTRLEFSGDTYFADTDISEDAIKRLGLLKRLADEHGQTDQALMFNAFELYTKAKQPNANGLFKIFTWLYDIFSNYGRSFGRPLFTYLGLVFITYLLALFAAANNSPQDCKGELWRIFSDMRDNGSPSCLSAELPDDKLKLNGYRAAFEYTTYRAAGILDFSDNDKQTVAVSKRLFNADVEPTWMRFWGIFKAIASAALLFLAALGLRNKYRIK